MFFPPSAVPPLRDEERSSESRRGSASPQGISPELSNLINQVLAIERIGPLRRGDFACGAQPARLDCGRCGAPAPYYFYKYGKLVLRMFYFSFLKSAFDLEIKSGQEKESQQG